MEFQQCVSLLASRPEHAHEYCEEEQNTQEQPRENATAESPLKGVNDPAEDEDLTELGALDLIQSFHRLQETRVQIYTDFRQGFQVHQKTEQFPAFCSGITERFAGVSERINNIEKILREKHQVALSQLLRKVQLEEKEKLLLTSAVLIEKMRLLDASKQPEPDDATIAFLERSVQTLTTKHTACVEHINELLEDLQAEGVDLQA